MADAETEDGTEARGRQVLPVVALVALVLSVGVLVGYLIGDADDDDSAPPVTTTTTESTTTTTVATTTTAPTTTEPALTPGDPCELGSERDCIDPDGDGQGTYLIGGGECMDTFAPDSPGLCEDLDGDGNAGYPDSG